MESLRNLARIASRRVQYLHSYSSNCRVLIRSTLAEETSQRSLRLTRQLRTTTKAEHERAVRTVKLAPRTTYQPTSATTWIISAGSVSADKEAIALAKGLGLPWVIKRVQWHQGLQWLPIPFRKLIMDYHHVVNRKQSDTLPWFLKGDPLTAPYPSFVIGSGPSALSGLLHVSRMSGKASFSAHIHFPALPFIHFDQVLLQRHEVVVQLAALGMMKDQRNYFRINSTLNTITPKSLEAARIHALEYGLIPKSFFTQGSASPFSSMPIVTVLIGGPNQDCSHNTDRIVNRLSRLIDVQNCRLLISYSQRTAQNTKQAIAKLQSRINDENKIFVYDPMTQSPSDIPTPASRHSKMAVSWNANVPGAVGVVGFMEEVNPYEAMLALANKIVVTADSVAMTNEALATGKPVYVLGSELARGKLKVFHRYLADRHATRAFRPGKIPIHSTSSFDSYLHRGVHHDKPRSKPVNDTADPLSYPGDHPPWAHEDQAGQGPSEAKRISERLKIMRECRVTGRRVPDHIAEATC
ncbi:MAG: mitochondrial fission ELM1-domain-containing protein [Benniella sp.]|nr:MAG: mitochondrial fission ELM1-domain-containing protein [Benniella sp.]